jgi:hypothetical protein
MHRFMPVLVVLAVLASPVVGSAQGLYYPGEELTYRVSYLNITLGTIRSVVENYTTLDGQRRAKVKVYLKSHPNIPFISLNAIYESWMDTSITHSYKFNANTEVEDGKWEFDQYTFDYSKMNIRMDKYRDKQKVFTKDVPIKGRYNDGSSLLFAARSMLYSKKSYKIPTVIMDEAVTTVINFQGVIGETEIDALDYPVRTVYFNGDANWTGIYGLTGRFEGWFSDDEARVPIKAKMKLYVGSATIELMSWKRGSWQPPRVKS